MTDIAELVRRNADFVSAEYSTGPALTINPTGNMMVIGCVDPRVDPSHVLGIKHGEAAVIRNVGGRITPATLRTLKMLRKVGEANPDGKASGPWNLVVLHHTDCGMTDLAPFEDVLAEYFEIPRDELAAKSVRDPYGSVHVDVDVIRQEIRRPDFFVSGLLYDVSTGTVEVVIPPTAVPTD
ncbi:MULTISPECIES: carbonic anhydrase [unclassified Streptomyces]|uniref:carbonic anhydrase n=1 Tax=unclassified Streptomyces TaxID=2593676 RepID=UPI00363467CC